MSPEETAATYNRIAQHWDCPEFNMRNGIAQHERALRFLQANGRALDVGCGSSGRIIDLLLKRGLAVEALDISNEMLKRAQQHHPDLTFYEADICTWDFPKRYDFISAWDSIWHVPLDQQLPVLRRICAGLSRGGVLIFTTGGVEKPEEITHPCFDQPLYHAVPGIPAVMATLTDAGYACRHLEYDQYPEKHVYIIAQRV